MTMTTTTMMILVFGGRRGKYMPLRINQWFR